MFGWFRRTPRYYAEEPTEGKRNRWWVGIIDRQTGARVFQSAPPGHPSEQAARIAAVRLQEGLEKGFRPARAPRERRT